MKKDAWLRVYVSILDPDDKTQAIPDRLFRQWLYLLAAYRKSGGVMPDEDSLCRCLRVAKSQIDVVLHSLVAAGLLEEIDGALVPHDWDVLQFESDSSSNRVRAFRERRKKQLGNVSETVLKRPQTRASGTENRVQSTENRIESVGVGSEGLRTNGHHPPIQASNEKLPDDVVDRIHRIADAYPTNDGYEEGCRILVQRLQSDAHPLKTLATFEANAPLWISEIAAGKSTLKPWYWFIQNNNWLKPPKLPAQTARPNKLAEARAILAAGKGRNDLR